MKKFFFLIFILQVSCSNSPSVKNYNTNTSFSKDMNFDEFRLKLEEYAFNNPYPDIKN
tara:strand:+ start:2818 stop:2991 length:174 start_codon:yes stop_codon:yes gene_type:complete